jgi:integrase
VQRVHTPWLTGQLVAFGKGGKTRSILLTPETWRELQSLRGEAADDDPMFVSRQRSKNDGRKALKPSQVYNFEEPAGPGYRKSKLAREPRKYPAN